MYFIYLYFFLMYFIDFFFLFACSFFSPIFYYLFLCFILLSCYCLPFLKCFLVISFSSYKSLCRSLFGISVHWFHHYFLGVYFFRLLFSYSLCISIEECITLNNCKVEFRNDTFLVSYRSGELMDVYKTSCLNVWPAQ